MAHRSVDFSWKLKLLTKPCVWPSDALCKFLWYHSLYSDIVKSTIKRKVNKWKNIARTALNRVRPSAGVRGWPRRCSASACPATRWRCTAARPSPCPTRSSSLSGGIRRERWSKAQNLFYLYLWVATWHPACEINRCKVVRDIRSFCWNRMGTFGGNGVRLRM